MLDRLPEFAWGPYDASVHLIGDPMTSVRTFLVWLTALALDRPTGEFPPPAQVVAEAREASVRCPYDLSFIGLGG